MNAWEVRDGETGALMLSDAAKHRVSEDRLESFFSSSASRQAYAVGTGRKIRSGVYSFPVILYESFHSSASKWTQPRFSHITVTRASKDDWAIDTLP